MDDCFRQLLVSMNISKKMGVTSSGTIGAYPTYTYMAYYDYRSADKFHHPQETYYDNSGSPNSIIRSSSPNLTSPSVNGSIVSYSRVVEKLINNGKSNGRIERCFTSFEDHPMNAQNAFPYTPPDYKEWCYGLLSKRGGFLVLIIQFRKEPSTSMILSLIIPMRQMETGSIILNR